MKFANLKVGEHKCVAVVNDAAGPTLIHTLSAGMELKLGDVIATGTPAGVGIGIKPPRFLKTGDVVRMEIEGLGVLENTTGLIACRPLLVSESMPLYLNNKGRQ